MLPASPLTCEKRNSQKRLKNVSESLRLFSPVMESVSFYFIKIFFKAIRSITFTVPSLFISAASGFFKPESGTASILTKYVTQCIV